MAESEHPWEAVAADLTTWLDTEASWYADAMRGGHRSPFAAQTSESQKLDYYRRKMFQETPDGQIQYDKPNPEGRSQLMSQLGVSGYTQVWDAVKPKAGRREPLVADDDQEPDIPEPPLE